MHNAFIEHKPSALQSGGSVLLDRALIERNLAAVGREDTDRSALNDNVFKCNLAAIRQTDGRFVPPAPVDCHLPCARRRGDRKSAIVAKLDVLAQRVRARGKNNLVTTTCGIDRSLECCVISWHLNRF